jgi:hypothetical protein
VSTVAIRSFALYLDGSSALSGGHVYRGAGASTAVTALA